MWLDRTHASIGLAWSVLGCICVSLVVPGGSFAIILACGRPYMNFWISK